MGKTVHVHGETLSVEPGVTVDDLKDAVGAPQDDIATYLEDGETVALSNRDDVYRTVPEGANLAFKPGSGTLFG